MLNPEDISVQELETLKGDAIGDSLFSRKGILSTLMLFSEIHKRGLTQEIEERLCILWDISMDKEVTSYLASLDYMCLAKNVLIFNDNSRLIEIVLGIMGNMICNDSNLIDTIGDDEELVTKILDCFTHKDTRVLIQLIRILRTVFYFYEIEKESKWIIHLIKFKPLGDIVTFILKSSTNNELLTITIKLLRSICDKSMEKQNFLKQLFKMSDLIVALLESFKQLISMELDSYSIIELTLISHWLRVFNVMLDSFNFEHLEHENILKILYIIHGILKPYEHSYNLFPIRSLDVDVIRESSYILLNIHYSYEIFPLNIDLLLMTIMFSIKTATHNRYSNRKEIDPEEIFNDLLCDLNRYWIQLVGLSTNKQIIHILHSCESEFYKYLISIIKSDPTIASEISEKMERAIVAVKKF